MTYSKGPESKHNDDEVNRVSKEHQHIDVRDGAVLRMDQIMEELPHREVDLHEATTKKRQYEETPIPPATNTQPLLRRTARMLLVKFGNLVTAEGTVSSGCQRSGVFSFLM